MGLKITDGNGTDETDARTGKPRVRYTSHMSGYIFKKNSEHPCTLTVTIASDDVIHMLETDPRHEAEISGELTCEFLSETPMAFDGGKFYVETHSDANLRFKSMVYEMLLPSLKEGGCFMRGIRVAHEETFVADQVTDSESIGVVIKDGPTFHGTAPLASGKVEIHLNDMAKELKEIEITGCGDDEETRSEWKAKFGYFIAGVLVETADLFAPTQYCPQSEARERRHLDLKGIEPEIYHLTANDGVPLVMTRYKCGSKGPVLFLHGLCVTSKIFSLDTIDKSAVEFFCEHGYDMWVPDLRFSVALPSHQNPTHINDSAEHDLPVIIDHILGETGSQDLQVFAHCIGSMTIHVALFGGHIHRSQIRSMVVSQAGFCMIMNPMNHLKANLYSMDIAGALGFNGLSAYTDKDAHPREKMMTMLSNLLVRSTVNRENHCKNEACHRITGIFGLLWEHRNLNETTHNTLTEWFGFGHVEYLRHILVTLRKGRLTDVDGHDIYIPDFKSKHRLQSAKYSEAMAKLDLPILYFVGERNQAWDQEATRQSYKRCKEANPQQHYEWFKVPDYGHLDCVMGKNAANDVFPRILPFLEKYASGQAQNNNDRLI